MTNSRREAELDRIDYELIKLEGEFKREVYWKKFPPPPASVWDKYFSKALLDHAMNLADIAVFGTKPRRKGKPITIKFFKQ
jgi:hypothetical protein